MDMVLVQRHYANLRAARVARYPGAAAHNNDFWPRRISTDRGRNNLHPLFRMGDPR